MSGAIAAGNPHTANAGAHALAHGGNAVDAVVAGTLAAFLAEPLLVSAGGAGMLTIALPSQPAAVVDFFSEAPGLGSEDSEGAPTRDFIAIEVDFGAASQVFHVGRGAAAVPKALDGLATATERFGRLPLADLIAPAVELARRGVELTPESAHVFSLLWPIQEVSADTVALYSRNGEPPRAGTRLHNPELAEVLLEFARERNTPERVRSGLVDHFGPSAGGLITNLDVEDARATVTSPHRFHCGEWEILSSPRPGGKMVQVITEELCRCAPERDPSRELARFAQASLAGFHARCNLAMPGCTTHLSAFDGDGGAASITLTNGEGCGYLIPGTGIQLNNFLGEEDLNPRGFHRHAPGEPLPSMLAPTIALHRGEPRLALGSGGANRIRSVVSEVLYRVMRGTPLEEAVLAPRVHAEARSVWTELENVPDPAALKEALAKSFDSIFAFPKRNFFFGGVHGVQRTAGGTLFAVGDPRRGGAVARTPPANS